MTVLTWEHPRSFREARGTSPTLAGPGLVRAVRARTTSASREFSAFLAVGLVATVVSVALYNLLAHSGAVGEASVLHQPVVAFVLSNAAGMVVSFIGTQRWVFRDRATAGPAGGLVGFVVVNVLSWVVPLASLAFSRYVLDLSSALADNVAANVVGLGLGTVLRFWVLRSAVFSARV